MAKNAIFNTVEEAIEDFREGRIVIVVDDEDRENEGDFIVAAEKITPEIVNFMLHNGRGVMCAPLTENRCKELELDMQVADNTSLLGTPFTMLATGMNPFINAQGYALIGMSSVAIGAVANLVLDPLFIFVFGLGVEGAAIATVISQFLSAAFVYHFLTRRAEFKVRLLRKGELRGCLGYAKNIISLGTAGFIMQLTNSLVTICCNNVLSVTGGDIYISVMTIVSSVRQLVETPIYAMNEGTSPILSYNYGARRPSRVRKAMCVMSAMILGYTAVMWSVIVLAPHALIGIFSSDAVLTADAVPALKQYFAAFIFMDLQYIGQTVFKSLNKKKQAIFFSLLRKVFIVVPLTYLMPYVLHMGTDGVFLAEPVSNVIGGSLCFITMLILVLPELKRMEQQK